MDIEITSKEKQGKLHRLEKHLEFLEEFFDSENEDVDRSNLPVPSLSGSQVIPINRNIKLLSRSNSVMASDVKKLSSLLIDQIHQY